MLRRLGAAPAPPRAPGPAVPVAARVRRGVADQRPAARHVQSCIPRQIPSTGTPALERGRARAPARTRRGARECGVIVGMRRAAVAGGVDVRAEAEHDAVGRRRARGRRRSR